MITGTIHLHLCRSGCVTSAETVLIQQQSYQRLLDKIDSNRDNKLVIAVAISPNSRASIAHFLGMNASECFLRIASVLKSLGVMYVVDAAAAGDVALMEAREEFVMRCSFYCLYTDFMLDRYLYPPSITSPLSDTSKDAVRRGRSRSAPQLCPRRRSLCLEQPQISLPHQYSWDP